MTPVRDHLTFVLNGVPQTVRGAPPLMTLLQWLRREKKLAGCKEGCAEGGCGACTVLVGALREGRTQYDAINACITFMPMLEGKSVTTVEGVCGPDGALHPSQQAMIECHGSQCGFCTPGVVMSLLALYRNARTAPDVAAIDDALAGNLCRCTGYGPIVDAAQKMFETPRPDWETEACGQETAAIARIQHRETVCAEHDGARMFVPLTEDELARHYLMHPDAVLIAGATDAALWVTKQARDMPLTIHTGRVRFVQQTVFDPAGSRDQLFFPAETTLQNSLAEMAKIAALTGLLRRFGGPQVRNAGTLGGNIANASPIGDLAPAFIALGATLHLRRGDERRALPLEDYFIAYAKQERRAGEFITGVSIAASHSGTGNLSVHKVSKRFDDDISAVCGAFHIVLDGTRVAEVRIAFGGMAGIPQRARAVEAALLGKPFTRATIDAALPAFVQDFAPISDVRATAAYRLQVAKNLLLRTYLERTAPAVPVQVADIRALADG